MWQSKCEKICGSIFYFKKKRKKNQQIRKYRAQIQMAKSQPDYCLFQLPLPESYQKTNSNMSTSQTPNPQSHVLRSVQVEAQPHFLESVLYVWLFLFLFLQLISINILNNNLEWHVSFSDYPVRDGKRGQFGRGVSRDALCTYAAGTIWTWR